jgi:hypothetical protein
MKHRIAMMMTRRKQAAQKQTPPTTLLLERMLHTINNYETKGFSKNEG